MISEGTDIPRLQVCCYLSLVRTELYFRQVLGRIIRHCGKEDEHCYFVMLSAPELMQFAQNLQTDIPSEYQIEIQNVELPVYVDTLSVSEDVEEREETKNELNLIPEAKVDANGYCEEKLMLGNERYCAPPEYSYGKFKEQLLTLSLNC